MKITGIEFRDVVVAFELPYKEIEHILSALDRATIEVNSAVEKEAQDVKVLNEFHKELQSALEAAERYGP